MEGSWNIHIFKQVFHTIFGTYHPKRKHSVVFFVLLTYMYTFIYRDKAKGNLVREVVLSVKHESIISTQHRNP